jgi:hypothetical protein
MSDGTCGRATAVEGQPCEPCCAGTGDGTGSWRKVTAARFVTVAHAAGGVAVTMTMP